MSAATIAPTSTVGASARLRFTGVLHSEWIKVSSLRSTWISLILMVALSVGLSLLIAATLTSMADPEIQDARSALSVSTVGLTIAQVLATVVGVLAVSGEYSSGMIRTTLAAAPSRLPVLAAKALVVFALVTVAGIVTLLGSWAATAPLLAEKGVDIGLAEPGVLLALLGGAAFLGFVAVFGVGIGALLRSAAGGITTVLGVLLVLPAIMPLLGMGAPWAVDVAPYLLSSSGAAMGQLPDDVTTVVDPQRGAPLPVWAAWLVTAGWAAAAFVAGAITLRRRDA